MKTLYDQLQEKHRALQDMQKGTKNKTEEEEFLDQIKALIQYIVKAGEFIGNAEKRENLRGLLRYWSALVYEKDHTYLPPQLTPFPGEYNDRSRTILIISVGTLSLLVVIAIAVLMFTNLPILHAPGTPTQEIAVSPPSVLPPIICPDNFWPGAEPAVYRWQSQRNEKQAVMQLKQLGDEFASASVLELQVELDGQDELKNAGEAFIDFRYDFPMGLQAPLNLEGKAITMAVYAPALAAGTDTQPNGVQIFVKSLDARDDSFKSEYGTWMDLTNNTDRWLEVSLTPARTPPPDGKMDPDFDPANIVLVGINIATQEGADVHYSGPIWISDVCWHT
jgi:hypothetical protein